MPVGLPDHALLAPEKVDRCERTVVVPQQNLQLRRWQARAVEQPSRHRLEGTLGSGIGDGEHPSRRAPVAVSEFGGICEQLFSRYAGSQCTIGKCERLASQRAACEVNRRARHIGSDHALNDDEMRFRQRNGVHQQTRLAARKATPPHQMDRARVPDQPQPVQRSGSALARDCTWIAPIHGLNEQRDLRRLLDSELVSPIAREQAIAEPNEHAMAQQATDVCVAEPVVAGFASPKRRQTGVVIPHRRSVARFTAPSGRCPQRSPRVDDATPQTHGVSPSTRGKVVNSRKRGLAEEDLDLFVAF
jgi:hypothetical protein